jgi:iron complex outermembrane receptor protein
MKMSMGIYRYRSLRIMLATSCAVLLATGANAQQAGQADKPDQLSDIVVTAQKRSQSARDVPITMSVLSGDALARQNAQSVTDAAQLVPNIQVNYGLGQNAFNVRGIGLQQFSSNFDSPVAVHVDEVYLSKSFMSNLLLFDIDRLEVLKGPQGTLFGRNTTGGSVNFYTNKPTSTFTAGGTVGYDNYRTVRTEAYVSGPLTDTISVRLSGMYNNQGKGYYHNVTTNRDEGYEKKFALRAQLQWKGPSTTILLTGTYGQDNSNLPPYLTPGTFTPQSMAAGSPTLCADYLNGTVNGGDASCVRSDGTYPGSKNPYISHGNVTHRGASRGSGITGRLTQDLGFADLTAISSYQYYLRRTQEDSDGNPAPSIETYYWNRINQFTQEVRLTSKGGGAWNYVLGGFYEHDAFLNNDYLTIAGATVPGDYSAFGQHLDAGALFFHNEVKVAPTLTLIAGARYSYEKLALSGGTFAGVGRTSSYPIVPTQIVGTLSLASLAENGGRRTDENVSFKVGMQWRPHLASNFVDDLMIYGTVSTGFRSGGFNAEYAAPQVALTSLAPETVTAYEAGFKSAIAGRTLQINGAVFRYDFRNGFMNVDSAFTPVPVTINAAKIMTYGAEADVRWLAARGLDFSASVGWLDPKIDSDITVGGKSLKGFRPVNSPHWTLSGGVNYTRPISDTLKLGASLDGSYRSSQYMSSVNAPSNLQAGYWIVNGQIRLAQIDDHWTVSAWVKNLTKTKYWTYVNDLPAFGFIIEVYGAPRTFGGTLGFKF